MSSGVLFRFLDEELLNQPVPAGFNGHDIDKPPGNLLGKPQRGCALDPAARALVNGDGLLQRPTRVLADRSVTGSLSAR